MNWTIPYHRFGKIKTYSIVSKGLTHHTNFACNNSLTTKCSRFNSGQITFSLSSRAETRTLIIHNFEALNETNQSYNDGEEYIYTCIMNVNVKARQNLASLFCRSRLIFQQTNKPSFAHLHTNKSH